MRVITSNPIISNNKVVNSDNFYLSAEGDPKIYEMLNSNQIKAFQKYANVKGITPKLTEDGIKGAKTAEAWKIYGDDFYKGAMGIVKATESANPFSISNLFTNIPKPKSKPVVKPIAQPIAQPIIEEKKGMSTTTKILIGVGSLAVLGTIIYLIARKK